jgi:hypothetical protein
MCSSVSQGFPFTTIHPSIHSFIQIGYLYFLSDGWMDGCCHHPQSDRQSIHNLTVIFTIIFFFNAIFINIIIIHFWTSLHVPWTVREGWSAHRCIRRDLGTARRYGGSGSLVVTRHPLIRPWSRRRCTCSNSSCVVMCYYVHCSEWAMEPRFHRNAK